MSELVLPGGARINMPTTDTQYILQALRSIQFLLEALLRLQLGFTNDEVVRDLGLVMTTAKQPKLTSLRRLVSVPEPEIEEEQRGKEGDDGFD